MDVDLFSSLIRDLIADHDQVGLPGMGTFVAELMPASFSDKGYTINPPYRRLSFYPACQEDSLLIESLARRSEVEIGPAAKTITDFLTELEIVLKEKKTVILPGLGRLRATRENNIFFVADQDINIYPDGFGLEAVSLKNLPGAVSHIEISTPDTKVLEPEMSSSDLESSKLKIESPSQQSVNEARLVSEQQEKPAKKMPVWLGILITVMVSAVIIVAAFVALAHFAPEILDKLLYSAEELEILNYKL